MVGEESTKLSRLIGRETIRGTAEDLAEAQEALDSEMRAEWDAKWDRLEAPARGADGYR